MSKVALTMNCLSNESSKSDSVKWTSVEQPNDDQKRMMLALVMAQGVKMVMTNHTYSVGDLFYLQSSGGAIGLNLTRALHRPYMRLWDLKYIEKVRQEGLNLLLFKRYIDDSNQSAQKQGKTKDELENELLRIANSIEDDIEMELDSGSNHDNGLLPILDMEVWICESTGDILYQHYEKPVSSRLLIPARSGVLIQMGVKEVYTLVK